MYVKVTNGIVEKFPYTIEELKKDNPEALIYKDLSDEVLQLFGMYKVVVDPLPDSWPITQTPAQDTVPVLENNVWCLKWTIRDYTVEELADIGGAYRQERNILLRECDWTHVTDSNLSDSQKAAWATYRQALRDITGQTGFPLEIVWPTKPA